MINIKPTNETIGDGRTIIELVDEPYTGIRFAYDKMNMDEAPLAEGESVDTPRQGILHFEYDVLPEFKDRVESMKAEFEQYIGALLVQVLEAQLARNEVVYSGGTGEYTTAE